jgi:hypothetical protein
MKCTHLTPLPNLHKPRYVIKLFRLYQCIEHNRESLYMHHHKLCHETILSSSFTPD